MKQIYHTITQLIHILHKIYFNDLRCDTREELNTILRKHVNEEGFDLVVKKNRKS